MKENYSDRAFKKFILNEKRRKIIFFAFLFSLVFIIAIMIFNYTLVYINDRDKMFKINRDTIESGNQNIDQLILRHQDILSTSGEALELLLKEDFETSDVKTLLTNISNIYSESIYLPSTGVTFNGVYASIDGKLVHGLKNEDELPSDYNTVDRQWYKEAIAANGAIVFSKPYRDIYDSSKLEIAVCKMLEDGVTVIAIDFLVDDLEKVIGDMSVSAVVNGEEKDYGYGFVVDSNGLVVANTSKVNKEKYNYTMQDISDDTHPMNSVYLKIKEHASSTTNYNEIDINGVKHVLFSRELCNGWYSATIVDLKEIKNATLDFSSFMLTGTLIVVAVSLMYCVFALITSKNSRRLNDRLEDALKAATIDSLTGYSNRTAYDIRVKELQDSIDEGKDESFIVFMMDLNDVKYINDKNDHTVGDQYIINSCELVRSIVTTELYRIGGDEFVMFLTGELYTHWEEIFDKLKYAVAKANLALIPDPDSPSIAIGLSLHVKGKKESVRELLKEADIEMYSNKAAIKQSRLENMETGYTEALKLKVLDKQILASEMKKGLEEEQFEIWFQPQVNHITGAMIGSEALVRWNHPKRGYISPATFIPMFEYNGFIYELDKYVWRYACKAINKLIGDGIDPLPISVNVSRLDLIQEDFIDTIIGILREENVPLELIHLEITESAFADETGQVVSIVKKLIDIGFVIAIDDFGSGYSSLSLLRHLPAHIVKLDMKFFSDGDNETRNECIIESTIRMIKMLGMGFLAEGVETVKQAETLKELGCSYVQGYLYSKAIPYRKYLEYIKRHISEIIFRKNELISSSNNNNNNNNNNNVDPTRELYHNIITGTNDAIIIGDINTKELLYANPKAEMFYNKKYDPLHYTTCNEYCDRKEHCKRCPLDKVKKGESFDDIILDNDRYIKIVYTKMNWNGHEAFISYQTDITDRMNDATYANNLLDNLGVSVAIFKGDAPGMIKPVFCNKEFTNFSGLTMEEFTSTTSSENMYGVSKKDYNSTRKAFSNSFHNNVPFKHYLRLNWPNRTDKWTYVYANVKHYDNYNFQVYMFFLDAEEEMRRRKIELERYAAHIENNMADNANVFTKLHFNLTTDECKVIYRDIEVKHVPDFNHGFERFVLTAVDNVMYDKSKKEFIEKLSLEEIKSKHERGMFITEIRVPMCLVDDEVIWCYQTVSVSKNPNTGDLEAITVLKEADKDIRKLECYKKIIQTDYELIANIDVATGLLTIVEENNSRTLKRIRKGAVPYMENLNERMSVLVEDDYVSECVKSLTIDEIFKNLLDKEYYICRYPAKQSLVNCKGYFKWKFSFIDDTKTEIVFTREMIINFNKE